MSRSVFELMRYAEMLNNETVVRFMKRFNKNVGISQVLVLSELRSKGPQKHSELSQTLGYSPGGMTTIANRLIKAGFAERQQDENDRRVVRLTITDSGREILHEAKEQGKQLHEEMYAVLTEEEVEQLMSIQKKLLDHMKLLPDVK